MRIKKILTLFLVLALLLSAAPAHAEDTAFSDVETGAWYESYLEKLAVLPGIISGYPDGTFRPDDTVSRGEFLKMAICAAQVTIYSYTTDTSRDSIHWAGRYYTLAQEDNLLVADVYAGENGVQNIFECTAAALDAPISRYEMAVIINNLCTNTLMEKTVIVTDAAAYITDYSQIDSAFITAVEQACGKGILTGFEDGSFCGDEYLTRAQAAAVIERLLYNGDRTMPDWAEEQPLTITTVSSSRPEGFQSFAEWLQDGHITSSGSIDSEARLRLFGNADKTYFSSATDAAGYMETITIPVWTMDKSGNKFSSTATLTVHKLVAEEVRLIFQQIYDDPEHFPIYGGWSVGGSRYTDTMRHAWGCAIDVNAYYNCECTYYPSSGYLKVTCGYGWWPVGASDSTFAGSMSAQSQYSIGNSPEQYGYSVVKAFADYGWGWGGNGYGLKSDGHIKYDYMHFSVLPSGV